MSDTYEDHEIHMSQVPKDILSIGYLQTVSSIDMTKAKSANTVFRHLESKRSCEV
jgi:hypothetical protein